MSRQTANQKVTRIFQAANPVLVNLIIAREVIPGMAEDLILHAGPPVSWEKMCGPMRGAIMGAVVYEGKAATLEEAARLLDAGSIRLEPCHDHAAVAPMAGIISPSMPVWVIENRTNGYRAYSNLNEGPGAALRYGANGPAVIARLRWMAATLAPRLKLALSQAPDGIAIFPLIREALQMGDECHSRNRAALALLVQTLLPLFLKTGLDSAEIGEVFDFLIGRDYFFLNLTMAACKAAWLEAEEVPGASIITAHARNGVEFGIRLQGKWFAAPSPVVDGHYFPQFTAADANLDIGDSAITEASGLGGFASGGASAVIDFIGGTPEELMARTLEMYSITDFESPHFQLKILNSRGTPTGVDVVKVVESGIRPFITTGIAHRLPGIGQIGAGRVRAPLECFEKAMQFLTESEQSSE